MTGLPAPLGPEAITTTITITITAPCPAPAPASASASTSEILVGLVFGALAFMAMALLCVWCGSTMERGRGLPARLEPPSPPQQQEQQEQQEQEQPQQQQEQQEQQEQEQEQKQEPRFGKPTVASLAKKNAATSG